MIYNEYLKPRKRFIQLKEVKSAMSFTSVSLIFITVTFREKKNDIVMTKQKFVRI